MPEDKNKATADKKAVAKKEDKIEVNPTVKRQLAAKDLRDAKAAEVAKANKEAEKKAKDQKSDAEKSDKKGPQKDTRKLFTDDRGLKFAFKYSTPKSINIDGKSCKTAELLENEEVMLELVYGNSNLIEQIH